MATLLDIAESAMNTKNNLSNEQDIFNHANIIRERLKLWQKVTRIDKTVSGVTTEYAVIIPYDTYIEPFYSNTCVDATYTTGVFDSTNQRYHLYSDANGNYKTLQTKTFIYEKDRTLNSVIIYVDCTKPDGTNGITYVDISLYNGNEWLAVNNTVNTLLIDYSSSDLDADLDADLGGQLSNLNGSGVLQFQNVMKLKIERNSDQEVYINNIMIKVT